MKKHSNVLVFIAILSLCCAMFAGCSFVTNKEVSNYTVDIRQATPASYSDDMTDMLARIRPTVVDVTSYGEEATAAGSGVIVGHSEESGQYFIVTNHHVIDGGSSFSVDVLSIAEDGTESTSVYDAQLIGSSLKRDIAVLTIAPRSSVVLQTAVFIADSDSVKVGTEVYAIGNPLGILGGTVTHGIVSATQRQVNVEQIGTMTLMQTDASINGGNSGGGLFNSQGELVGVINSGYDTYNEQSVEGLNFAIPANDVRYAVKSLIDTHEESGGKVTAYGYVEGDAKLDVSFSVATLYSSSTLTSRDNYLIAAASTYDSPFYQLWGSGSKAVVSVSVNGKAVDLSQSGGSSYALVAIANNALMNVKAGDAVTIEYKDILSSRNIFGMARNYVDSVVKTATVTATQYVYAPNIA